MAYYSQSELTNKKDNGTITLKYNVAVPYKYKKMDYNFYLTAVLLGIGLAMDAFSVSIANGLNEPKMKIKRMCLIAGVFAGFQFVMPIIGWFCVHTAVEHFKVFELFIPWIALILLGFIGGKMLYEGFKHINEPDDSASYTGAVALFVQGVATSIDALSVGFTISHYNTPMAFTSATIIAAVTFVICMSGLVIGKKFGDKLSNKAQILGGAILIAIGIEIFLT